MEYLYQQVLIKLGDQTQQGQIWDFSKGKGGGGGSGLDLGLQNRWDMPTKFCNLFFLFFFTFLFTLQR